MTTPAETRRADIAILGDGLTARCLALLLNRHLPGCRLERLHPVPKAAVDATSHRAIALSEGSRRILVELGVWPRIEQAAAAIVEIDVSDRGHPGSVRMKAGEQNLASYGHVIEYRDLTSLIADELQERVTASPKQVDYQQLRLRPVRGGMQISAGQFQVEAQLVLVADGALRQALQALGFGFLEKDYDQTALTAELILSEAHGGLAFERFTGTGPVALLPLKPGGGRSRASLVWTLPPARAEELFALPEQRFIAELNGVLGGRSVAVAKVRHRKLISLSRVLASEQWRRHVILLGSVAHSLHPVAGQGFNLTLRDIETLAKLLAQARAREENLGDLALLESYGRQRSADQRRVVAFSDHLPRLFANGSPLVAAGRNLGLLALDAVPPLRHAFARFGAGLHKPGVRAR